MTPYWKRGILAGIILSLFITMLPFSVASANEGGSGIECKLLDAMDPTCYVEKWLSEIAESALESGLKFIAKLVQEPDKLLKNEKVKEFQGYFQNAVWSFITVFFTFQLVKILSMYWVEEDSVRLKRTLTKLIVTVAMISGYMWSFNELVKVANETTSGFADIGLEPQRFSTIFVITPSTPGFLILMFLLFAILVLIVAFQVAIRAAELAFLFITGPFAIATNINEEFNLFPVWWRNFLSILITQVVQIMLLVLTVKLFWNVKITNISTLENIIWGLGMMIITIKGPAYIKEYMYSTGAGQAVIGGAMRAGGVVGREVVRRVIRKG